MKHAHNLPHYQALRQADVKIYKSDGDALLLSIRWDIYKELLKAKERRADQLTQAHCGVEVWK